ncbi:SDR family NAD(P)-dependent oxidoreductase [Tsukamurella sputi]|uniref:SDR family NAD(P)-dependent oxidoreductase n=1 Tax=Tsukamurella sputi TaxID=2591848 RepID=A0A5C5RNQ7_9ACTN|nr:SDR family NAD(P)-dependent oxidoreductase [Tsukamurella sputi]TWS24729.1 SDR family NAD(P)-dependent oxidoreductase [Tsukamurella sputi]
MSADRIPDGAVLLLGGRSEVGLEVARRIAPGRDVILAARRSEHLDEQIAMLREVGATGVFPIEFDADRTEQHTAFLDEVADRFGRIGVAVVAFGILGDQARAEADPAHAVQIAQTDYVAQVSILLGLAKLLRAQDTRAGTRGAIVAFSSVAGVRVRKANFVYGSTKAGLDGFVQGFTDSLHGSGVQVLLARPGFIVGAMTRDLMASGVTPAPFSRTAAQVAEATVHALRRGRRTVWIPPLLRPLYAGLRFVPQAVWRRMPR